MSAADPLTELDQQIIVALQINGRASWRQIAAQVGERERTVARHGNRLLSTGVVRVVALEHERIGPGDPALLRLRCAPQAVRGAAASLAARHECLWVYAVAGANEAAAEIFCPSDQLAAFLLDDISALPGLSAYSAHPVLSYFQTVDGWHPGLTDRTALAPLAYQGGGTPVDQFGPPIELGESDRILVEQLKRDGRLTHDELASAAGISKATAGRRVEMLRSTSLVSIRAVVDPALLGYPVEAVLWIKCTPHAISTVGAALAGIPEVRYAAAIGGEHQLVAQVAMRNRTDLHHFITAQSQWGPEISSVEVSLVIDVYKRSNIIPPPHSAHVDGDGSTPRPVAAG